MARQSSLRFGAQTDEVTSLLHVVNLVRRGDAATRPELGRLTGLGRGVVTQRVDQAIEMGYLEDGEFGPSSGGRAPRTLRFRSSQGYLVVCALGAMHLHVGLTALEGDVLDQSHRAWDIGRGPTETVETAMAMVDELLARNPPLPIWGVGIGVPGPVDFASGRPVAPPIMPGWNGFDLRGAFERQYDAPAWVDNDVNLLAFSERARRKEQRPDLLYCKVGTGIGVGLLSQGRIHRGANGAAGDIGHERVHGSDLVCRCGKVGCLETVAAGWALVRDAEAAIAGGSSSSLRQGDPLTAERIARAAEEGDPLAVSLVQSSAHVVGEALASVVNMFNPAVIVLGGAVAAVAGEIFLAEVRHRVYELSLPLATRDLTIVQSLGDLREPLRGGAEMLREQLFEVTFARWFAEGRPRLHALRETAAV